MPPHPCSRNPELWFSEASKDVLTAKAECALCPAFEACRELGADEPFGVWGGQSAKDRDSQNSASDAERDAELNGRIVAFLRDGMSVRALANVLDMPRRTLADRIKRFDLAV
ncbi:WhiB family transcriptional regulator [Streptomyces sp. NPDC056230]|uniref:WhiB family transcriptional regulator n=1 Tax=Streptomyces sp. NPDC056230 TaxID=3345754 RepID=UPI0035DAA61E